MGRPRKYESIADDLTQRISRGVYATGEALPPERALASDFEVTRLTLRKAIDRLVAEGVLRRFSLRIAHNRKPDAYTLEIVDLLSGERQTRSFRVR